MEHTLAGVASLVWDIQSKQTSFYNLSPQVLADDVRLYGYIRRAKLLKHCIGNFTWLVGGPEVERKFGKRRAPNYIRLHNSGYAWIKSGGTIEACFCFDNLIYDLLDVQEIELT